MGMFDTIFNIPVKCPKCGNKNFKSAQIKDGPQILSNYEFGKDKIPINCNELICRNIIGIAECVSCEERINNKMDEIISEYKKYGDLTCPDGAKLLVECEINGKNALKVVLDNLDKIYGGNHYLEYLFDIIIKIENGIAVEAEVLL